MRINLSRRFAIHIGVILLAGVLVFFYVDARSRASLIAEMGFGEAEKLSKSVFEQLLTSMRLGGGRSENRAVIERFARIDGIEDVRVIHGESVDLQFGTEEDELPRDELDALALAGEATSRVERAGGHRVARHVMPVFVRQECTGCHEAAVGAVNGAISVSVSLKEYEGVVGRHRRDMFAWGGAIILAVSLAVFLLVHRRLIGPLARLRQGAEAISEGRLDYRVGLATGDETELVAVAFDRMAASLLSATSELKSLGEKYSRLVDTAADAILLRDLETKRYIEVNSAAIGLLGYSRDELLEMTPGDLCLPGLLDEYREAVSRWSFEGRGRLQELVVRRKDGSAVPIEVAASIVEIGGRKCLQEIWRDISERKGFERTISRHVEELEETVRDRTRELHRSLRDLEEAYARLKSSEQALIQSAKLASLGEMGAGIAHELNSPLAGILSITEVLMNRIPDSDPNYHMLEKIKDAAVRSKYIIMDMLIYSRPSRAPLEPMFLNEAIRATLTMYTSEIKTSLLEVVEDFAPDLPKVTGNKGQVMEVVLNILKNARDAMGGCGRLYIGTRAVEQDGALYSMAEFRDTGPGVPEGVMDKIFDPFFTTKEKGGGHNIGLGLSISQSIIKEHGGRIEAENHPGGGAVFRVWLPACTEA